MRKKNRFLNKITPLFYPAFILTLSILFFWGTPHARFLLDLHFTTHLENFFDKIILSMIFFITAWFINVVIDVFLFNYLLAKKLKITIPVLLKNINKIMIFFICLLSVISIIYDKPISGIITALSAASLVIGFAFKNLLSDIIDGVSLSIDKPFKVGDFIRFQDLSLDVYATVVETTWRSTRFKTDVAGILVMPNSELYRKTYTNLTTTGEAFYEVNFKFDLHVPIEETKRMLLSAAISTPGVLPFPTPEVAIERINHGYMLYQLFFAYDPVKNKQRLMFDAVISKVHELVSFTNYSFAVDKEQHIVRKTKPCEEEKVQLSHRKFLEKVPLFDGLNDDEYQILLDGIELLEFKPNTKIIEIDDKLASLFVIQEGMLSVHIKSGKKQIKVAYLTAGTFLGEMSLLTGLKASATIITETPTCLYQINKQVMKSLFEKNPKLIKSISFTIAERQENNNKTKADHMTAAQQKAATKSIADKLVSNIYDFFKL